MSTAYSRPGMTLREVNSNVTSWDQKDRMRMPASSSNVGNYYTQQQAQGTNSHSSSMDSNEFTRTSTGPLNSARGANPHDRVQRYPSLGRFSSSNNNIGGTSGLNSPGFDKKKAMTHPAHCAEIAGDIVDMFHTRERAINRDSEYLNAQNEVTEKMRTILVDWLVDVHLKFKLHSETFFLACDIVDRYLAQAKVSRNQLQLVGITAILLAAKYEEIWPPEVKECLHISANTYSRDDLLKMERAIMACLQFKLTVPTPYPFLVRLLETTESDDLTKHAAMMFAEYASQDYKCLRYLPSQVANASVYLANVLLGRGDAWNHTCQHYSRARQSEFAGTCDRLLQYVHSMQDTKYQAIKRKYSSSKFGEVARMTLPTTLPDDGL